MVTLEQVTKLREYANISFEEAKAALEATNGDVLEAIVNLEKQNRIKSPDGGGSYNTAQQAAPPTENGSDAKSESASTQSTSFGELIGRFFRWCGRVIHKGNINSLEVLRGKENIMSIPVTVLVLLLIVAFWIVIPLIIIGLFFDYRYRFAGPDLGKEHVNRAMDSVAEAADNFKHEVKGDKTDGTHTDH
jgi:hypothetical protein